MRRTLHVFLAALTLTAAAISSQATTLTFTASNFVFTPGGSRTIALGDTVKWVWSSGTHNTNSTTIPAGAATWFANLTGPTTTFTYIPTVAGTHRFNCTIHPSAMIDSFIVTGCTNPITPVVTSSNGLSACVGGTPVSLGTPAQAGATYQWYTGATAIPGATTPTLNVPTTMAGTTTFSIKVSRCNTDATSNTVSVTVNALPVPTFTETHTGLTYTFTNTTASAASNTYVWTFSDGSPTQTTTNATRTFAAAGNYTVTLMATTTATTCSATSAPLSLQAKLGIGTLAGESYSILPNPAASSIAVNAPAGASLTMTDLSGRAVKTPLSGADKLRRIDVSALPAGMYLLHIVTEAASVTEKIIVAH